MICKKLLAALLLLGALLAVRAEHFDARKDLKLTGGERDHELLKQALSSGKTNIYFPEGTYYLGTVELPDDSNLKFSPRARIKVNRDAVIEADGKTPLFLLSGDRIKIDGFHSNDLFDQRGDKNHLLVKYFAYGKNCTGLVFSNLRLDTEPREIGTPRWFVPHVIPSGIELENCRDITLEKSYFRGINHGIQTTFCENVSVHGNTAFNCSTISSFSYGTRGARHFDNWSRKVRYQCCFRGGSPDPSRMAKVPQGSSATVLRSLKYEDRNDPEKAASELLQIGAAGVLLKENSVLHHLYGVYDIQISNNYAEYGRTLAWGNKARQVIFDHNISRFMNDYSYGVEGCENVVFSNNISINARSCAIMSMYWGANLNITGNTCIVRDEPYLQEYSDFPDQSGYWGGLLRFHHGPTTAEDTGAGSRYGAGNVLVSGNILMNDLTDRVRGIVIDEGGRDITISGNKFLNANIAKKKNGGRIVVQGNEFNSHMPKSHPQVSFNGSEELVIRDNTMKYMRKDVPLMSLKEVDYNVQDEAQKADEVEKLKEHLPAIIAGSKWFNAAKIIIEGNLIEGWPEDVIVLQSAAKPKACDVIIRNNTLQGKIRLQGRKNGFRHHVKNNIDSGTFEESTPGLEF